MKNTPQPPNRWLKPAEIAALLAAAMTHAPELVPILVVQLFCGVRLAEALKLRWSDIRLSAGSIGVNFAKPGTSRFVPIAPNVSEWLIAAQQSGALIFAGTRSGYRAKLRKLLNLTGISIGRSSLRRSFVAYHYARSRSPHLTASELGLSGMPLVSFAEPLISAADAAAFWDIRPPRSTTD